MKKFIIFLFLLTCLVTYLNLPKYTVIYNTYWYNSWYGTWDKEMVHKSCTKKFHKLPNIKKMVMNDALKNNCMPDSIQIVAVFQECNLIKRVKYDL